MEEKKEALTKKQIAKRIAAGAFLLIANLIFFLMMWIIDRYDSVQFDQVFYQIKAPMTGTNGGIVGNAILKIFGFGIPFAALEFAIYLFISGRLKGLLSKFKGYAKYSASRTALFFKKRFTSLSAALLLISVFIFIFRLDIHAFVIDTVTHTDFIENHYVDPKETEITFEEKKNLIYIYLESMENTFSDTSVGGNVTENFIPELTDLASQNVSFTGKDGKAGAYSYVGTRWTAAALFAQTSGAIMKVPMNFYVYGKDGTYMPGIKTLGDILQEEGYNQSILLGSDSRFAARDAYFKEHGNYNIIDVYSLIDEGKLPDDYWEWWGVEDSKLFDFAKEEILRLAELGEPFNFTTLTADTHVPDGYFCDECESIYDNQYANVLRCSSKQVQEFINWCKEQPFYENTTIILSGDHLTMDPDFVFGIDENYVRTTYNCIINPAVTPISETGREFGTFDMFPTTLAAIGAKIEGERLGLGVNLFSSEKTLTEIYGFEKLEDELKNNSKFYIESFYKKENAQAS